MRVLVQNLSFSYLNKPVIKDLNFNLRSGDFLLIHGKNGTGKSTFVKCLLKMEKINDEMIYLDDIDLNHIKTFTNIGYVPQKNDFNYEFPITVYEILYCSYRFKDLEYFKSIINTLGLQSIINENINNLSGGQIQRVFIARALLNKPKLLILDEPTVGVDLENVVIIHDVLKKLKEQEITIILITHDFEYCQDICTHLLTLSDQCVYEFKKIEVSI